MPSSNVLTSSSGVTWDDSLSSASTDSGCCCCTGDIESMHSPSPSPSDICLIYVDDSSFTTGT